MRSRIKCWILRERESGKIEDSDVDGEFQECLPEEDSARGWWTRGRVAGSGLLNPTNHTDTVCKAQHLQELFCQGEIRW